ncbi:hypothetical protein C1N81_30750 [Streptomyces sp. SGAir0957]
MEIKTGSVWVDITKDVKTSDPIVHSRGIRNRGVVAEPATMPMRINNAGGKYSPRNPMGPYYGFIGRNTPVRMSLHHGPTYLAVNGTGFGNTGASTPDTAALDIVGDIDIRFEATLDNWLAAGTVELCGKGLGSGNQRSWMLMMTDQRLRLRWSTDGTAFTFRDSTELLTMPSPTLAVRATLDVNNGASGHTVVFYTAPSMAGPWTQLGAPVVTSGTTSIFNSSAPVRAGDGWGDVGFPSASGRVTRFELRNGIGGTVVANPNFTILTPGTTTFTDPAGRTWTVGFDTEITNRRPRFVGEISSWPRQWTPSAAMAWVQVEAAGVLRRYSQGQKPLESTLRRRLPSQGPIAYWPMEEGENATQAASPIAGVRPLNVSGFRMAATDTLPGSKALPQVQGGATLSGLVPTPPAGAAAEWHTEFVCFIDSPPPAPRTILQWLSTGTVKRWRLMITAGGVDLHGYGDNDVEVTYILSVLPQIFGRWTRWKLFATQSGNTVTYTIAWVFVGAGSLASSNSYTGSVGRISGVIDPGPYSGDLSSATIGHLAVFPTADTYAFNDGDHGFNGESAAARMIRLCQEESAPLQITGAAADTLRVGPQRPSDLLTLLADAAAADGGVFGEDQGSASLWYRTRASLYSQTPALTLPFGSLSPPFEPVEDDEVRNDRTVVREGGSSARAALTSGRLSVQPPPAGIGMYDDSTTLNLYTDGQTELVAGWMLHLGTWDEDRYPEITLLLHRHPELIDAVLALRVGDVIRITDVPTWVATGDILLRVDGWSETLLPRTWAIRFACSPAGPWTVGVYGSARRDSGGSALAAGVSATATSLSVATTSGPLWTTTASDFPFDILVGGERMRVTGVTGASSPQTMTVVRSVNGIAKAQSSGAAVGLFQPAVRAL